MTTDAGDLDRHTLRRPARGRPPHVARRHAAAVGLDRWRPVAPSQRLLTNLNGDLAISSINGVATDPTRLTTIVAGSEANGTNVFSNDLTWDRVDGYGGGKVAIDPNNADTIYAVSLLTGTNAVLRKSTNGGISWSTVLAIGNPTALTVDDVNSAGPGRRLPDHGVRERRDLDQPPAPITVQDLAIANAQGAFVLDPNFLQVTDKGTNAYDADTIYVTNGELDLRHQEPRPELDRPHLQPGRAGSIVDIEVDPRNRDTIYAVRAAFGGGHVFRSTDAGRTWINISNDLPNLPTWRIVIDPRNGFLYAGTDEGVFSTNGGDAGTASASACRWCRSATRTQPDLQHARRRHLRPQRLPALPRNRPSARRSTPRSLRLLHLDGPGHSSANPAPIASPWAPTARRTCRTRSSASLNFVGPISD